ncbi:MAG: hypothetical protein AAB605_03800 [Patescibacteria group bacterium]
MAWENNAGRNGNYQVLKPFRIYLDTIVIDDVTVPQASFDVGDVIAVEYCIDDYARGPGYSVKKADKNVSTTLFRRTLEDLIKVEAVKQE